MVAVFTKASNFMWPDSSSQQLPSGLEDRMGIPSGGHFFSLISTGMMLNTTHLGDNCARVQIITNINAQQAVPSVMNVRTWGTQGTRKESGREPNGLVEISLLLTKPPILPQPRIELKRVFIPHHRDCYP